MLKFIKLTLIHALQVCSQRLSVGMTPKTLRLPKPGEMLLSVHGSPLGVYKEENMEAINGTSSSHWLSLSPFFQKYFLRFWKGQVIFIWSWIFLLLWHICLASRYGFNWLILCTLVNTVSPKLGFPHGFHNNIWFMCRIRRGLKTGKILL